MLYDELFLEVIFLGGAGVIVSFLVRINTLYIFESLSNPFSYLKKSLNLKMGGGGRFLSYFIGILIFLEATASLVVTFSLTH